MTNKHTWSSVAPNQLGMTLPLSFIAHIINWPTHPSPYISPINSIMTHLLVFSHIARVRLHFLSYFLHLMVCRSHISQWFLHLLVGGFHISQWFPHLVVGVFHISR